MTVIPALLALMAPSPNNAITGNLLMFGAIFAIFYFIMIRPQQKQRREHENRLKALKRGDEVVTTGGIVGEIIHIKETVKDGQPARALDDRITIKSGESRLVVERGKIATVSARSTESGSAA